MEKLDWHDLSRGIALTYEEGAKAFKKAVRTCAPEHLHLWRKRVKDSWYQLRMIEPIQPLVFAGLVRRMKLLSEYLGDDHDLAILEETAADAGLPARDLAAFFSLTRSRRSRLQRNAFRLGRRLYVEKPAAIARRIRQCAKTGRCR